MDIENNLDRRKFLAVSVGAVAMIGGCTSDEGGPDGASDETEAEPTKTPEGGNSNTDTDENEKREGTSSSKSTSVKLGEVVDGGDLSMVVRKVTKTEKLGEYQEADEGNTYVVIRLAVKNTSKAFIDFSSFWQTRVKDSQNHVYDATFGVTDHPFDGGSLAPGEVSRGDVLYEVPKNANGLTMQLDFTTFDLFDFDRVMVDLKATADSIGNLEQTLDVDFHSIGKSASKDGVSVTVHDIRTESQIGSYSKASDGYQYVIPDFEITNDTDEPLTVSTLLQMRVKTDGGFSYSADLTGSSALDRAYNEGSEIAPGESRRGELAFEVDADAKATYFVFDFYDFGESYKAFWKLT